MPKDFYKRKIVTTADGSHTLGLTGNNEHYHSTHGAIQESRHVFIDKGLLAFDRETDPVNILEVGMGTGLNVLLTVEQVLLNKKNIQYLALEPFPLTDEEVLFLNYPALLKDPALGKAFQDMHNCKECVNTQLVNGFSFTRLMQSVQSAVLPADAFHLVYFDAFGPDVQPEMWEQPVFDKIFLSMKKGGMLLTYCAKGLVKRSMKAAGFRVGGLPGPPGKREISRAIKPSTA